MGIRPHLPVREVVTPQRVPTVLIVPTESFVMEKSWNRIGVGVCVALSLTGGFAPGAALASESAVAENVLAVASSDEPGGFVSVNTQLNNPSRPGDLNGGCSYCRAEKIVHSGTGQGDSAELELYYNDGGFDVDADIELRLLLVDDSIRVVLIEDVVLLHDEDHFFEVLHGEDWLWTDVRHAWVEVIPEE